MLVLYGYSYKHLLNNYVLLRMEQNIIIYLELTSILKFSLKNLAIRENCSLGCRRRSLLNVVIDINDKIENMSRNKSPQTKIMLLGDLFVIASQKRNIFNYIRRKSLQNICHRKLNETLYSVNRIFYLELSGNFCSTNSPLFITTHQITLDSSCSFNLLRFKLYYKYFF